MFGSNHNDDRESISLGSIADRWIGYINGQIVMLIGNRQLTTPHVVTVRARLNRQMPQDMLIGLSKKVRFAINNHPGYIIDAGKIVQRIEDADPPIIEFSVTISPDFDESSDFQES